MAEIKKTQPSEALLAPYL